jgi:hypothetical protein
MTTNFNRNTNKLIAMILSASFFTTSIPAYPLSWGKKSVDSPKIVQGESYLKNCDGLLDAITQEDVEKFLLGQVTSPGQALKLLADYGILYSKEFREAILLTLSERGIELPPIVEGEMPVFSEVFGWNRLKKEYKNFGRGVLKTAQLPDQDFKLFVADVLKNLQKAVDTSEAGNSAENQSRSFVTHRFVAAVTDLENQNVSLVFNDFLKMTLLATIEGPVEKAALKLNGFLDDVGVPFFGAGMIGFMGSIVLMTLTMGSFGLLPHETVARHAVLNLVELASGFVGLGVAWSVVKFNQSRTRAKIRNLNSQRNSAQFRVATDSGLQLHLRGLIKNYVQTTESMMLSIDQVASASDLSKFNAVQLLYLGHLDLLQVQAMGDFIAHSLGSVGLDDRFSDIRAVASSLRADPNNYVNRVTFRQRVLTTLENTNAIEQTVRTSLAQLNERTTLLAKQLAALRSKIYDFPTAQFSDQLIRNNQILAVKLETDLQTLSSLQLNQEQILARFEQLRPILQELSDSLLKGEGTTEGWRQAASKILLVLDQTEKGDRQ